MTEQNTKTFTRHGDITIDKEQGIFKSGRDGMSTATARIAIGKKLRKKIMEDYDLLELADKGRYYVAKACSKDGHWLNELLIDKQTGNIRVANRQRVVIEKER